MPNTDLTVDEHLVRKLATGERLAEIEKTHSVALTFDYDLNEIVADGLEPDVQAALAKLQPRVAFAEAIKQRQPPPKIKRVKVRLSAETFTKEVEKQKYVRWLTFKSGYYQPTETQLEKMFSVVEEGWEVLPDFAHSFTCRLPDGRLVQVDRRGRVTEPSPYSPHLPKVIEETEE
jgi:hypothetical protein